MSDRFTSAARSILARAILGVLVVSGVVGATFVGTAAADGDPASDWLYGQHYYVPSSHLNPITVSDLMTTISKIYGRTTRVKVAVIATRTDLGSIPSLLNKPDQYARFLGTEIASYYVGPLLIVMPRGFGFYNGAGSMDTARRALKNVAVRTGSANELVETATRAVRALSRAHALKWRDVSPPLAFPFTSVGVRGQTALLRYSSLDDSGYARVDFSILTQDGLQIAQLTTKMQRIKLHGLPNVAWRVPTDAPGELRFCVIATDPAGHRSAKTCGLLHIS